MPDAQSRRPLQRWALTCVGLHVLLWVVLYFMAMDMWASAPVRDTFGGKADMFAMAIGLWFCSGVAAMVLLLAGLYRARHRY